MRRRAWAKLRDVGVFGNSLGTATVTTGTKAGTYNGQVLSMAMSTHEIPAAGDGVLLEVTVFARDGAAGFL